MKPLQVGVLDGADVLYVERIQAGLARLGVDIRVGSQVPVYSTAVGRPSSHGCQKKRRSKFLNRALACELTDHTLVDLDALLSRLDQVRARGYALSDQENVFGLRVLAAPVLARDGTPVAGLSVAAPVRMPPKEFEQAAWRPVVAAAAQLSRALHSLGGYPPRVHSSSS